MFPIYVYEDGMELPNSGTYYVVAGNGIWLYKDTGIVKGLVKVPEISHLPDLKSGFLQYQLPKIPQKYVWQIKEFFKQVVLKHQTEAVVTVYYQKNLDEYSIVVNPQMVSYGSAKYVRNQSSWSFHRTGCQLIGTIHSHCDFGAFHSGVDEDDERDFDGLHITFGHNDKDNFTISASIVSNNQRLKVAPTTVLEGIESNEFSCRLLPANKDDIEVWSGEVAEWMEHIFKKGI